MEIVTISQLLTDAFALAKSSKGPDWRRMTIAVLKNRLLHITNNNFRESDYGYSSMVDLVKKNPELMTLDLSAKPPVAEWKSSEAISDENTNIPASHKIRADLWNAILDYSSGDEHEWDPSENIARRTSTARPEQKLPTIDKTIMAEWRNKFIAIHRADFSADPVILERINKWAAEVLPNAVIPRPLQGEWNSFLKDRVAERLAAWFTENGFSRIPIIETKQKETPKQLQDSLRELLHKCIDAMTVEELGSLPIPASIMLRIARHGV